MAGDQSGNFDRVGGKRIFYKVEDNADILCYHIDKRNVHLSEI